MSRVHVGLDKITDFRGRTEGYTDMDFLNVCYTKAPSGQLLTDGQSLNSFKSAVCVILIPPKMDHVCCELELGTKRESGSHN